MNAATLFADRGWDVTTLTAPVAGFDIVQPIDPRIRVRSIRARKSHRLRADDYGRYLLSSAVLALRKRPDVIYASDMASAGPGLLAQRLSGAKLVYHEHDNPSPGRAHSYLQRMRETMLRKASRLVFPNAQRAENVVIELGLQPQRVMVAWNVPRRAELPAIRQSADGPLGLYFHGSITPDRLPLALVDAIRPFGGQVELRIAGYEAPGASGYLANLLAQARSESGISYARYLGQIPCRSELLEVAARAHIGLALMPSTTNDINMRHMTGASNKPFDYMAAGLPLLVSDLPDWQQMFVAPGYGLACKPDDANSIADAIRWFIEHPGERLAMGARARARIEKDWNYDTAFTPIIDALSDG